MPQMTEGKGLRIVCWATSATRVTVLSLASLAMRWMESHVAKALPAKTPASRARWAGVPNVPSCRARTIASEVAKRARVTVSRTEANAEATKGPKTRVTTRDASGPTHRSARTALAMVAAAVQRPRRDMNSQHHP